MNHLYWLSQIQASEKTLVGDKLFIISQLLLNNCPMMPGFVLDKGLLEEFLTLAFSETLISDLSESFWQIEAENYRILQAIARRSREAIAAATFPTTWQERIFQAARQLNSQALILSPHPVISQAREINSLWRSQTCWLTPEALAEGIKRVWRELFTAKSLFYYRQLGLSFNSLDVAVLVQPLKAIRASGTVEISPNLIRLQATEGLVQSLLWGEVQPDSYELDSTGNLLVRQLGNKNYAYRLGNFSEEQLETCLEAYIPDETRAENYILNSQAIAQLFESLTEILQHRPQTKYLEWILDVDDEANNKPRFYFTYLSEQLSWAIEKSHSLSSTPSSIQPLLTGLAAAPGSILASATTIADLNTAGSEAIPAGCILVTKNVPPDKISLLKQIGGIITEEGGITSHGAIVARELGIPAIVAARDATIIIAQGQNIFLDGDTGGVYSEAIPTFTTSSVEPSSFEGEITTQLMVNLSQPAAIKNAASLPVAGVGLLRSELMLSELLASEPIEVWQQEAKRRQFCDTAVALIEQFAAAFAPRPVFYRSLDLYADRTSINPIVGSRGTYKYLLAPHLFDLELEALARVARKYANLNLILPFVRSVAEFEFCRRRVERIGLSQRDSFQLWIMAEVPSVLFLLPQYVRAGVRGIAIGTNDLTQLFLGIDREQADFSQRGLNEAHPALQLAIAQLIQTAKANNIPCCLCGQAPVIYPELIEKLIDWGITSISVEPQSVRTTREAIARAERRLRQNRLHGSAGENF